MKTVGIVGGIGPESTIDYYRLIIAEWRRRTNDDSYPSIVINSINLTILRRLLAAERFEEAAEYLLAAVQRLDRAGVDFAAVAANAAHIVFDAVRDKTSLPLISIVEATREEASSRGLKRVGLFGNKFVTEGRFYIDKFKEAGITLVVPSQEERDYIDQKYFDELVPGVFLDETRNGLLAIVERFRVQEGLEALILGGTELPLILRDAPDQKIPFLDTTQIHVKQIVAQLL